MTEKYQPSNGTEGDIFMSRWCFQCVLLKDEDDEYCEILGLTFSSNFDDKDYPSEWTYDENGNPCCTAYLHDGEKPEPRCSRTADMFSGVEL